VNAMSLHESCLGQGGAVEDFTFGPEHSAFKVAGKMFSAIRPGNRLNKRHWNTITLDGSLPDKLVRELIEDSYDLDVSALPKRTRATLGWPSR